MRRVILFVTALLLPSLVRSQARAMPVASRSDASAAVRQAQESLVDELLSAPGRTRVSLPGRYRVARASVEHRTGLVWHGPDPLVILVDDGRHGFPCDDAKCLARLESVRVRVGTETVVATVLLVVERALMSDDVWEHELTHAILAQHGRFEESHRHDARWFPRSFEMF